MFSNGDSYQGSWIDGLQSGKGITSYADCSVLEGTFMSGKPHGQCFHSFSNKDSYLGEYLLGQKHGKGHLEMNGAQYSGTFLNDMKHGYGTCTSKEITYIGEFKHNMKDGEGTMIYSTKNQFQGHWKQDQKNEKGIWTYAATGK